jgi:hypothetical protein
MNVFSNDFDYKVMFANILCIENKTQIIDDTKLSSKNILYGKFLSVFNELKSSNHFSNPLFIQMIALEIFSFDKELFRKNKLYVNNIEMILTDMSQYQMTSFDDDSNSLATNSTILSISGNIINSYIEEVSTLRGIFEKIIKRYIKKNNWSLNNSISLSTGLFFVFINIFYQNLL